MTHIIERVSNRKRSQNEVEFVVKRPRKEIDFLHAQLEDKFREATKYAKQGNRNLMEYKLSEAKKCAERTNSMSQYTTRANQIEQQLGDEKRFLEETFKKATEHAKKGDRCWMDFELSNAKRAAEKANLTWFYVERAKEVEQQMGDEDEETHLMDRIKSTFKEATKYAKEGNRLWMEANLVAAKANVDAINALFEKRLSAIKQQLVDEKKHHLSQMRYWLEQAEENAKTGDRDQMEANLKRARTSASKADAMSQYEGRAIQIEVLFYGAEEMLKGFPTLKTPIRNTSKQLNQDTQQNSQTVSNNEDEIIVENQLDINQLISRKVKDAERRGDVINIS